MKRFKISLAMLAIVFAIGSAFTTAFETIGFARDSQNQVVSEVTNEEGCELGLTTNCTITVENVLYSPVYDSEPNIGNPTKILKYN